MENVLLKREPIFGHSKFLQDTKLLLAQKTKNDIFFNQYFTFNLLQYSDQNIYQMQQVANAYLAQLQYLPFHFLQGENWNISSEEFEKNFVAFWSTQVSVMTWDINKYKISESLFRGCVRDQIDVTAYLMGMDYKGMSIVLDGIGYLSVENLCDMVYQALIILTKLLQEKTEE